MGFAGKSDKIINEGECIYPPTTPSPTGTPSASPTGYPTLELTTSQPTESPTTTEPTESPRVDTGEPTLGKTEPPTAVPTEGVDPLPPVPPQCPEDLTLAKITGVTMPEELGDAVQVLSQDTSTVNVRLLNAWSTDEVVDSIFYYYHTDHLHDTCVEETDVPPGDDYADITLSCYTHASFAELDICVVDGNGALSEGDTAEVPQCCHPGEIEVPVVCYKILVQCESICVDSEERFRALRGAR